MTNTKQKPIERMKPIPMLRPVFRKVVKLDPKAWADDESHRLNEIEAYAFVCRCGIFCPDVEAALAHLNQVSR